MKRFTDIAFTVLVLNSLVATPAFAYLDPGTASIMLQSVIGAVAGGLVIGKLYLKKIKDFVLRTRTAAGPNEDDAA